MLDGTRNAAPLTCEIDSQNHQPRVVCKHDCQGIFWRGLRRFCGSLLVGQ